MLLLTSTSDKVQLTLGTAVSTVEVHADWMDNASGTVTPGRINTDFTTTTAADIVGSPGASTQRNVKNLNIKNSDSATSTTVEVTHLDGTLTQSLIKVLLLPGEVLLYTETGMWLHYSSDGVLKSQVPVKVFNGSVASQGAGFASDTYLTGSFVVLPTSPKVLTRYRCKVDVSKTAAGTATPIITVRIGTAGTTSDSAAHTLTFNAGTAAADVGSFEIELTFRTVGSGTSAVTQCRASCIHSLSTTGLINTPSQVLQSTSSGFNSTTSGLGIGLSVNGGTSASWTVQKVDAEIENIY